MKHSTKKCSPSTDPEPCDRPQCMMRCPWCSLKNKTTFARFHDALLPQGATISIAENMNHLIFLSEGYLNIRLKEADYILKKGHMVFFSRFEAVQITARESSLVVWLDFNNRVVFGGQDCLATLADLPRQHVPEFADLDIRPAVERLITLMRMMMHHNEDSRCFHALKEYELFMYLWEEYSPEERIALFHAVACPRDDLRAFMLNNYDPTLCGADYANLIYVSRSTFNRLFMKTFGMPFYKWLVKHKEQDLQDALASGVRDSKVLAERLGFKNVLSLYRFCRNRFGCSFLTLADKLVIHPQSVDRPKPQ